MTDSAPQDGKAKRIAALVASNEFRRTRTVERLRAAIKQLKHDHENISAETVRKATGIAYTTISRNPEAKALFCANSTFLLSKRQDEAPTQDDAQCTVRRARTPDKPCPDGLMSWKKSKLVTRCHSLEKQVVALKAAVISVTSRQLPIRRHNLMLQAELTLRDARLAQLVNRPPGSSRIDGD